jgi:hypothetical protein
MQTDALPQRDARHAERIGIPKVLLRRERKFADILETSDIFGFKPHFVETLLVERGIHTLTHGLLQAFELQASEFLTGKRFVFGVKVR